MAQVTSLIQRQTFGPDAESQHSVPRQSVGLVTSEPGTMLTLGAWLCLHLRSCNPEADWCMQQLLIMHESPYLTIVLFDVHVDNVNALGQLVIQKAC